VFWIVQNFSQNSSWRLNNFIGRAFTEKLTSLQLVKKFPEFYRTRKFIAAFASILSLFWATVIQSIPPHHKLWPSHFRRVRKIANTTISLVLPVCLCPSAQNSAFHWTNFLVRYLSIFPEPVAKIYVSLNSDKYNGTSQDELYTFMKACRWNLLRMRNDSDKSSREHKSTRILFNKFFPKIVSFMR